MLPCSVIFCFKPKVGPVAVKPEKLNRREVSNVHTRNMLTVAINYRHSACQILDHV